VSRVGFVRVGGPQAGQTDWLPRLPASIGSDADADIVVPASAARHAVVFERDGAVVLLDSGSPLGTYLAGQLVQEAILRPGDVIELGPSGPRLLFERESEGGARARGHDPLLSVPVGHGVASASQTLILRTMAQSSRAFRRAMVAAGVVGALLLAWTWHENRRIQADLFNLRQAMSRVEAERHTLEARVDAERKRGDDARQSLEQRIEDYRSREDDLRARLAGAAAGEVRDLRDEIGTTRQRIATLETERAAGEQIIKQYGGGVCLIQGAYSFYDAGGRPLRYKEGADDHDGADISTLLTTEGDGLVYTVEYYGTGFLVQAGGLVLTNRHVAEPWWNDNTASTLQGQGYQPRFLYLRGFFPRQREPFEFKLARTSPKYDLALVRTTIHGRSIPVLPLEQESKRTLPGQPVVVVGYPTGLEAILAKAESGVVRRILESHGTDSEHVTVALSRQGLIRPSTTQGHIGDITHTDIVFDAPSAQGGSGGPVFNKFGQVIAVEYAVLQKFGGNSFGVPIAYARELLAEPARPRSD
jgi:S1-C subfamily serine protease